MFFIEKLFSKIYSHLLILGIFGEFGFNFCDFARNKTLGMLFNLRG